MFQVFFLPIHNENVKPFVFTLYQYQSTNIRIRKIFMIKPNPLKMIINFVFSLSFSTTNFHWKPDPKAIIQKKCMKNYLIKFSYWGPIIKIACHRNSNMGNKNLHWRYFYFTFSPFSHCRETCLVLYRLLLLQNAKIGSGK